MKNGLSSTSIPADVHTLCINTIRFLSVDAVQKANSGHPGMPLGAAPMAFVLWTRFLRHNPANPGWLDHDRCVLSSGHGSMLLYSLLHLTGYDLPLEEIERFRQWRSRPPGHPDRWVAPGIETTTGPLGQGFGNAVGMAIAESHLAVRFNRPRFKIIDHYTYCLAGDGDLMEGVAAEAASLAGHLGLGKLICLYDDNRLSPAASTDLVFSEVRAGRFAAYGWHVQTVAEGNDLATIGRAIAKARNETSRPSIILIRTHIGHGSPDKPDSFEVNGSPLGAEEVKLTKENLGWPLDPLFYIPKKALRYFHLALKQGKKREAEWNARFAAYEEAYPELARELRQAMAGKLPPGWDTDIPNFPADSEGMATRVASGMVMNAIAPRLTSFLGGSADPDPSPHTSLKGLGDFGNPPLPPVDRPAALGEERGYGGRNLHFGVREHAMGAVLNGMAAHGGLIPFGATVLKFSDYLRPSLRLAALMGLHVIHIFTHDSIGMGEDGLTHQPVVHLATLRAIPNLVVIRPADANETAVAWQVALETADRPVALVLSRQDLPIIDRSRYAKAEGLRRGGYILADAEGKPPALIFIATGSEVALVLAAREKLLERNILTRVVSLPSWELFDQQPQEYCDSVLPPQVSRRLAVEAGAPQGWHSYIGSDGNVLGVERFGASAQGDVVPAECGLTVENVCRRALALLEEDGPP